MTDKKYLRDRPFLIVEFTQRAKAKVNTKIKGWMNDPTNLTTFENVSIVDRVKPRHSTAALIIDIIDGKAIRNTTGKGDEDVIGHYIGRYADTIKDALTAWAHSQVAKGMVTQSLETVDSALEDFGGAPVGEGQGTLVEVLPEGEITEVIEDLEYFQQKLSEGLKIPSSYTDESPE